MLIDFHAHCFPDKIAPKAVEKLRFASGGLKYNTDGTLEGLKSSMKKSGVDASVVLNIATNAAQQKNVNDFASAINNGKDIFSFGSVYPLAEDALDELSRIKEMGLKGVKLHPDYQGFKVDDERLIPLYKKISSLGLITVFHAGFDYGFPPPYGAPPKAMAKAFSYFETPVIAAHWGGLNMCDDVLKYLAGSDIYFDISYGYGAMPKYYALKIIEKHGADRILFGTDSPWHTPEMELAMLSTLALGNDETDKITHLNAMKLLGMEK